MGTRGGDQFRRDYLPILQTPKVNASHLPYRLYGRAVVGYAHGPATDCVEDRRRTGERISYHPE